MLVPCVYDGMEEKVSSKGNPFANIYVRGVDEDGTAGFIQKHYMSFDEEVIKALRAKKKDDIINLDLEIREATVIGVGV